MKNFYTVKRIKMPPWPIADLEPGYLPKQQSQSKWVLLDAAHARSWPIESGTPDYWLITRINVPYERRGKGYGSNLLRQITEDADREGIELRLWPEATGGLTQRQLEKWYERNGFEWSPIGNVMIRQPRRSQNDV